jgi:hypothetical protein
VIFNWQQIIPGAIENLNPLHRDIVMYLMSLPGKRKPEYTHAKRMWNLDRDQFDRELEMAFTAIRHQLTRYALSRSTDLEFV